MDFSWVIKCLKLASNTLLGVFILAGIILFIPTKFAEILDVNQIRETSRPWISLAFLSSGALLTGNLIFNGFNWFRSWSNARKHWVLIKKYLADLTSEEKIVLRKFIFEKTKTNRLSFNDGVVQCLEHNDIIYTIAEAGVYGNVVYNIRPQVWRYLNKNKQLLNINEKNSPP